MNVTVGRAHTGAPVLSMSYASAARKITDAGVTASMAEVQALKPELDWIRHNYVSVASVEAVIAR